MFLEHSICYKLSGIPVEKLDQYHQKFTGINGLLGMHARHDTSSTKLWNLVLVRSQLDAVYQQLQLLIKELNKDKSNADSICLFCSPTNTQTQHATTTTIFTNLQFDPSKGTFCQVVKKSVEKPSANESSHIIPPACDAKIGGVPSLNISKTNNRSQSCLDKLEQKLAAMEKIMEQYESKLQGFENNMTTKLDE